jgi:hypothetical protein
VHTKTSHTQTPTSGETVEQVMGTDLTVVASSEAVDHPLVRAVTDLVPAGTPVVYRRDRDLPAQAVLVTKGCRRVLVTTVPADGHLDLWPYAGRAGIHYLAFLPAATRWLTTLLTRTETTGRTGADEDPEACPRCGSRADSPDTSCPLCARGATS